MGNQKITIRVLVAKTGLSDKAILRARGSQINECRLYTLETIAPLGRAAKDLYEKFTGSG